MRKRKFLQALKMQISSGEYYSINTKLNLRIRFVGQKQKLIKASGISSSILVKCFSKCRFGFLCNFPGTFVDIRFIITAQERIITTMLIHVRKIFNC